MSTIQKHISFSGTTNDFQRRHFVFPRRLKVVVVAVVVVVVVDVVVVEVN